MCANGGGDHCSWSSEELQVLGRRPRPLSVAANIAESIDVKGVTGTREPSLTHLPVGGVVPVGGPETGEKLARLLAPMAEDRMKRRKGENVIVSHGEMRRPILVTVPRGRTRVAGAPQTCHGFPSRRSRRRGHSLLESRGSTHWAHYWRKRPGSRPHMK